MMTVMFASRNGAGVLPAMLAALSKVREPRGGWRAIAVDNGSDDETSDMLRAYEQRMPLQVFYEATPGKSHALNRALQHAQGDLFVFCDDDVVVPENWLEAWRGIADEQREYALFGGLTLPLWPKPPPDWIARDVNIPIVFAVHEGSHEGPCSADRMHGTNMAIRSEALASGATFDTAIGPDGTATYPMGCETELAVRLEMAGHKCWFTARPAAKHIIRHEQLAPGWILQRAYRFGRGEGHLNRPHPIGPRALAAKNAAKRLLYPLVIGLYAQRSQWRRLWQWAFDMGYEDAIREKCGRAPQWRERAERLLMECSQAAMPDARADQSALLGPVVE